MQFAAIIAAAFAAGVAALPHVSERQANNGTVSAGQLECGNGQVISCCNSEGSGNGGLLGSLLGGNCDPIDVNVIGGQVPLNEACGNNQAACCSGSQTGLVNVQCLPVGL